MQKNDFMILLAIELSRRKRIDRSDSKLKNKSAMTIVSKTEIIITFNYQAEYDTALEIVGKEAA